MDTAKNRIMIFGPKSDGNLRGGVQDLRGRVARDLGAERRDRGPEVLGQELGVLRDYESVVENGAD
jgi:hypothetical protein